MNRVSLTKSSRCSKPHLRNVRIQYVNSTKCFIGASGILWVRKYMCVLPARVRALRKRRDDRAARKANKSSAEHQKTKQNTNEKPKQNIKGERCKETHWISHFMPGRRRWRGRGFNRVRPTPSVAAPPPPRPCPAPAHES
jgi:hypothetical protein